MSEMTAWAVSSWYDSYRATPTHYLDDVQVCWGNDDDVVQEWDTAQTQDALITGLSGSNNWILTTKTRLNAGYDFAYPASATPTLFVNDGTASTTNWMSFSFHDGNGYLDTGTGSIYIQDAIYAATHLHMGDGDVFYQGTGDDFLMQFNGTDEALSFAAMPVDVVGAGYRLTLPAGGTVSVGTTGRAGGFGYYTAGAGSNGKAGGNNAGGAGGYWTWLAGAGGAAAQTGGGSANGAAAGDFTWTGATGGAGAGAAGIGGAGTSFLLAAGAGGAGTGANGAAGSVTLRAGLHYVEPQAAAAHTYLTIDSGTGLSTECRLDLGSTLTTGLALSWSGVKGLIVDDAAIAAYTAASDTAGKPVFIRAQSGGTHVAGNPAGADINFYPGAAGAGGSGAAGVVKFWNAAGAGSNSVSVYHDATDGVIRADAGKLYIRASSASVGWDGSAFCPVVANTKTIGSATLEFLGGYFGEDTVTGPVSTSGLYLGLAQEARIRYNKDATAMPASTLILGLSATGVAAQDRLAISSAAITGFNALTNVAGADIYFQGGQSGLDNNKNGGSTYWTAGTAHGSGTGGSIVLTPGGTTSGTAGALLVRSLSGGAGKDVSIYHNASNGYVAALTGYLWFSGGGTDFWGVTSKTMIGNGTNSYDVGSGTYELKAVYVGEDTVGAPAISTSGLYLGLAQEARWRWNKDATGFPAASLILGLAAVGSPAADRLAFSSAAITAFTQTVADTSGNDLFAATQNGSTHAAANPDGADFTLRMGAPGAGGAGVHGYFSVAVGALGNVLSCGGNNTARMLGFFGQTPAIQQTKAGHNNWAAISDVVSALVNLGLVDQV